MVKKNISLIILIIAVLIAVAGVIFSFVTILDARQLLAESGDSSLSRLDKVKGEANGVKDKLIEEVSRQEADNKGKIEAELGDVESEYSENTDELEGLKDALDLTEDSIPTVSLLPYVRVDNYGADGSDTIDDTAAIQKAIDKVKDGGSVYFPAGEYHISSTVYFYSNQTLRFEAGAKLVRISGACKVMLANAASKTDSEYSTCENVDIIGATFYGGSSAIQVIPLSLVHANNIRIEDCIFENGSSSNNIALNSCNNVKISACCFENTNTVSEISEGYIHIYTASADNTASTNIEIYGCRFSVPSTDSAITLSDAEHSYIRIHDNIFDASAQSEGVIEIFADVKAIDIYSNTFSNAKVAILSKAETKKEVSVYGNRFTNVTTAYSGNVTAFTNLVNGNNVSSN